jgi:hypothetical protein
MLKRQRELRSIREEFEQSPDRMAAEILRLREGLNKLVRLEAEPHFGNSTGNIARRLLEGCQS